MLTGIDFTHDPGARSWVVSANAAETDFPLQNLPHGVFRRRGRHEAWRGGVAIGAQVLDLAAVVASGRLSDGLERTAIEAASRDSLNSLMALGRPAWRALRALLFRLLRDGAQEAVWLAECLVPQDEVEFALPAQVRNYTDFFTSRHHMLNAGRIFQPNAGPLENFGWLPIAYHGRASTVEVSGADFARPRGITVDGEGRVGFGPTKALDYELELGAWIGPGNHRGAPIAVADAEEHLFGLTLLNDWSARDVQRFEALPLGPFLAKNFLTTVSPWIVTLEALAPFRCALPREPGDPPTLPHLRTAEPRPGIDLQLQALLRTATGGPVEMPLSRSSFRHCHWSLSQMVAHHTEGGCSLLPGDLLGTGTQSGPVDGEQGCLLELTQNGRRPLTLPTGESRGYLEDGDTVILRAWAESPGRRRIGFGECRGTVSPPRPPVADTPSHGASTG